MATIQVSRQARDPGPAAWDAILPPALAYPGLEDERVADWLVIGAGFAGLAAARRLRQLHPKASIIVLEARRIAAGPAGRNSGFMIDLPHNLASDDYAGAPEADRIQTAMNRSAISFARDAASDYDMSREAFVVSGKTNVAASEKGVRHNLSYARHLAKLGEPHELLDGCQVQELCGSDYYRSGLYTPGTAMLQPALFVRGMAAGLAARCVGIFEDSPVTELKRAAGVWTAKTGKGSVQAPRVILAVNGHAESFGFFKQRLMHVCLYASMTRALSEDEQRRLGGERLWAFTPADPMGTTVRKISGTGGTRIIVRNRFTWNPDRSADEVRLKTFGKAHGKTFRARFAMLNGVEMEYCWGGFLCLSRNNVAAFGEVDEGLFSACCQNGLGAARGTLSGMLAADLASGHDSDHLRYMLGQPQPSRLPPEPIASIGAKAVLRWGEFKAGAEL
ncbi:MAG: FAD-binding oxidoreductase [Pseudomonadota bacterium]